MMKLTEFLNSAEREYVQHRRLSSGTSSTFLDLSPEIHKTIEPAFNLLSLSDIPIGDSNEKAELDQTERFTISRLLLLKIAADSDDPRWSSDLLQRIFHAVFSIPGSNINDLLIPFYRFLSSVSLTEPVQNLIKDVKIQAICQHQEALAGFDSGWIRSAMNPRISSAQAWFILWFLPVEDYDAQLLVQVLTQLETTHFWKQALCDLQDVITRADLKTDLEQWLQQQEASPCKNVIREMLQ